MRRRDPLDALAMALVVAMNLATICVLVSQCIGCGAPAAFRALPTAERTAWNECAPAMRAELCSSTSTRAHCLRRRKAQFADGATPRRRGMWLMRHGCPPPTVARFYQ